MKDLTCNICDKRNSCKQLCNAMEKTLNNTISKNKSYSETTVKDYNLYVSDIDNISIYTHGLSDIEHRDVKRIIIAILTKDQIKLLELYSQGYTQKEIGEKLNVTQSSISQKLEAIKRELRSSVVQILPYVV
ncbi:histidine kinase [Brachyspira hampsonii]|uniref:Histidine kinase n=2 Tax=Brachyspira hampsonii TaxID=1287055 RepID=A0AAC9TVJ2_9SPIR|nr:sigma factor-like helix-turn-helix DNA-binding protein [Brachyspira hampsonii]ASJ21587.1 histidine kinase [Brachyspira hampsonii]MBW5409153.1 histidine kinase [Brachyspira hampsonii]OEJ16544.1 histidine kinase [Brachyspira hampsonii]PTY39488.1 histidine kinase [Brachyspira hampsonii bv. II]